MNKYNIIGSYRVITYVDTYAIYSFHYSTTSVFLKDPMFKPVAIYYVLKRKKKVPIAGFFYTYEIKGSNLKEFYKNIKRYINEHSVRFKHKYSKKKAAIKM